MEVLDQQMMAYSARLQTDLRIGSSKCSRLATEIYEEVLSLTDDVKSEIRNASPISVQDRWDELVAFQYWMDSMHVIDKHPATARAQVIVQNYICFVYLSESIFKTLRQKASTGSVLKKCCMYLTDNPVRAFRNAIAHANWKYNPNYSGIVFWAKKGNNLDEPMSEWEVTQQELGFWQRLSRCVAYTVYEVLK